MTVNLSERGIIERKNGRRNGFWEIKKWISYVSDSLHIWLFIVFFVLHKMYNVKHVIAMKPNNPFLVYGYNSPDWSQNYTRVIVYW